jgi:hypothetical protein
MWLRDIFLKNLWMKLASLALATLIWYTVWLAIKDEKRLTGNPLVPSTTCTFSNLPVLVTATAADVRAFRVRPTTVEVTLRGRVEAIQQLTEKEVRAEVYLADIESAADLHKRVEVFAPPGFAVVEVKPSDVAVDVVIPPKQ